MTFLLFPRAGGNAPPELITAAKALRGALESHDVRPTGLYPSRRAAEIAAGMISVHAAAVLAADLTGRLAPGEGEQDWDDFDIGTRAADDLTDAARAATGSAVRLDTLYHPPCLRCGVAAAVELGTLPVPATRQFIAALHATAP